MRPLEKNAKEARELREPKTNDQLSYFSRIVTQFSVATADKEKDYELVFYLSVT
jgi:hypothetical protein